MRAAGKKELEPFVDHVWVRRVCGVKCLLCGAVARHAPPAPTPESWSPDRYEPLTDGERESGNHLPRRTP